MDKFYGECDAESPSFNLSSSQNRNDEDWIKYTGMIVKLSNIIINTRWTTKFNIILWI